MRIEQLQPGDMVYAATDIRNDGSIPDLEAGALIATAGCRGVVINIGHLEEHEAQDVYLVRFEVEGGLSAPLGCWPDELTADAPE